MRSTSVEGEIRREEKREEEEKRWRRGREKDISRCGGEPWPCHCKYAAATILPQTTLWSQKDYTK